MERTHCLSGITRMSLAAFQSVLAQLVTSAMFRENVVALGEHALTDFELTVKERTRIVRLATDAGVKVTATLVESFRFAKIVKLMPLTRILLGDTRLAEEARRFWLHHPPRSFYAVDEVIAFCDHLANGIEMGADMPYLEDVLSLERTMLELRRPRADDAPVTRLIRFHSDPVGLLAPLAAGRVPDDVRPLQCALLVTVREDGSIDWSREVGGELS